MKTINLDLSNSLRKKVLQILTALIFAFSVFNTSFSQPLKLGQSVVTSYDAVHDYYNAVKIIDLRNRPDYTVGGNFWNPNTYTGPNWDHTRMGNVFGIAIDDAVPPNIFVARSTVYSNTSRMNYPGMIYKIDGTTWNVIDYVSKSNSPGPPVVNANTIPNTGPGLGNICYDKWHKQLFVTNHEDGMIYQIKDDGTGLLGLVKDVFDPFNDDVPVNGFVVRGERIWGIGVFGRSSADVRLYFGRWKSDYGYQSNGENEIWSVALDYNGNFLKTTERIELSLPILSTTFSFSSPPSDIEFSYKGDMAVSERTTYDDHLAAHFSRILVYPRNIYNNYENTNYTWNKIGILENIPGSPTNSCGGVDFEYGVIDSTTNSYFLCDSVIVGTGDYLFNRPGFGLVYGLQFTEKNYGDLPQFKDKSHFIDLNGIYGGQDKTTPGDVDVYRKNSCSCNYADSLYIKDTPADIGQEPNTQSGSVMWASEDIWVCNNGSSTCTGHGNPKHGIKNYVKVRVRNGNVNSQSSCGGVLTLQWAKASTGLSWPKPWDASVTYGPSNLQMGGIIGSQNIPQISAYGETILTFEWNPPDPNTYFPDFGGDKGHFCLLARIETSQNAPYGMTFPETNGLYSNVQNNKKIAWKNVEVVNGLRIVDVPIAVYAANFTPLVAPKKLSFNDPNGGLLFNHATVTAKLSKSLYQIWSAGGKQGSNIAEQSDSSIKILGIGAYITNILMDSNSIHEMSVKTVKNPLSDSTFLPGYTLDVIQYDASTNDIEGGNRFSINTVPTVLPVNLKVIMEGFYNIGNNELNSGDTVRAYLRITTAPYSIIDLSDAFIDPVSFSGSFMFSNAPSGNYYIQINHRNSIETWSANPVLITGDTTTKYDFTTSLSKAYGNNMVLVGGLASIFSGDVNQDGLIDISDIVSCYNASATFLTGYVDTDLNGDGLVDIGDIVVAYNNSVKFIQVMSP